MNKTKNDYTDLKIYRETGQLVRSGINIYDYEDGKLIRNNLRLDSIAFDSSFSQDAWDYYTSSNLPLSSLHYGLIDKVTNSNPVLYRIIFALFDCLLSVVISLLMIRYWKLKNNWDDLVLIVGIAALSPALLLCGSIIPEDKGLQMLFMIAAIILAKEKKLILGAIFLGLSIAYKGLGIFLYPLCVFFIAGEPENILKLKIPQIKQIIYYSLIAFVFTIVWFLPYMPEVIEMMRNRLVSNIIVEPGHESIWTLVYTRFPQSWSEIKTIFVVLISSLWTLVFIIRKFNPAAISLFLLVLFVDVMLLQGSLDRMNIGIIVSASLFCFVDLKYCRILAWYTIIVGWILLMKNIVFGSPNETIDAIYATGYVILFSLYPLYLLTLILLRKSSVKNTI